jgi:hypothetical protein
MPDARSPELLRIHPIRPVGVAVSAAALCFVAGLGAAATLLERDATPPPDRCALPAGIELDALTAADRSMVVRRALACVDYERGRATLAEYRAAIAEAPPPTPMPPLAMATVMWASTIRDVSTEYSSLNWSAGRVLGAPDVFPAGGDQVNAWASRGADDRVEHLEVGFATPRRLSAVEIFETFNPGAVSRVELIGVDGSHRIAYQGAAETLSTPSHRRRVEVGCTDVAIAAIRITVDSPAVPGWNEIDAIGGTTCD